MVRVAVAVVCSMIGRVQMQRVHGVCYMTVKVLVALVGLLMTPFIVSAQFGDEFVPVTDEILQQPDAKDWLMWRRTLDGWGYSPLDQVTRDNVDQLQMVWSRALAPGRQEGTPLAYNGVLYMPQASDVIEAIDALTGDLKWSHRRALPDDVYDYVGGNARNNRNIAIYDRFMVEPFTVVVNFKRNISHIY